MNCTLAQVEVAELARMAAGGDQDAWREIVRRYLPLVWAVAREHRLDRADAADVSQSTWVALTRHLPTLRHPERLAAWLATTARRECGRVHALRRREVRTDRLEDIPAEHGPEAQAMRAARDEALWQAFAGLPERCQRLLGILARAPELTYAQVGHALGLKAGSIGTTRGRCLATLRRRLAQLEVHEVAL
jgi:RNA polymerase sigma factor (sigma-70 family)